jgi:hypothetical protein
MISAAPLTLFAGLASPARRYRDGFAINSRRDPNQDTGFGYAGWFGAKSLAESARDE